MQAIHVADFFFPHCSALSPAPLYVCSALAKHSFSMLCPCRTLPCYALRCLRPAMAMLSSSMPLRCCPSPCHAMPLLCLVTPSGSLLCPRFATQIFALRCLALPSHNHSLLCYAFALLFNASLRNAFAMYFLASLCPCCAFLSHAIRCYALALPCYAELCPCAYSKMSENSAALSSRISQRNLPLPLLRHCPSPRSLP